MALELLGEAATARRARIPSQLQCDSSAKMRGQECQGCPASHVANSPETTPSEFLGLRSRQRLDTGGWHSSCDHKNRPTAFHICPWPTQHFARCYKRFLMGWKRWARLERHTRMQTSYLNVVVNASRYDLIAGVVEGYSQDLVCVLKCLDGCFFPDIPQLKRHGGYKAYIEIFNNKITKKFTKLHIYFAETQTALLKFTFKSQKISTENTVEGWCD